LGSVSIGIKNTVTIYLKIQISISLHTISDGSGVTTESETVNNVVKDIGGEYALHLPIAQKHVIDLGYQFTNNQTEYEYIFQSLGSNNFTNRFAINGDGINHTIYSEYKYKTPKTFINVGIRGSQLSNVNSFFLEPRMFSSYELWNNFTVNTSAEIKNQQLNNYLTYNSAFGDIQTLPVADNIWILSNNSREFEAEEGEEEDPLVLSIVKSMQFTLGALYTNKRCFLS